jgi:hypothetical protein
MFCFVVSCGFWRNQNSYKYLIICQSNQDSNSYARMSIAIVRATHVCLRGSRVPSSQMSHRRPQWEDKAGLSLFRHKTLSWLWLSIWFSSRRNSAALLQQSRLPFLISIPITDSVIDPFFYQEDSNEKHRWHLIICVSVDFALSLIKGTDQTPNSKCCVPEHENE